VVNKSTVPVGTADQVKSTIDSQLIQMGRRVDYSVVSNPEFLKEGAAVDDFIRPDRIVIGTYNDDSGLKAKELMRKLYAPFNRHHERTYYMDVRSAELTKYASNAMLATRISFMNELANLAERVGGDIESVRLGIGSDSRIGHGFLYAGTGYGGSCFPKDVQALIEIGNQCQFTLQILKAVESVNQQQKTILVDKIVGHYGNDLRGKVFAMWGLAFKPNTDDMREAPSRVIIHELVKRGATIQVYDPVAMKEAQHCLEIDFQDNPNQLSQVIFKNGMQAAANGADALVIVTEWKSFRLPDFNDLKKHLKAQVIFDGRNIYDPSEMILLGFKYYGVGRNKV
jgi:UDPglucose 6-dehydrogenase